MRFLANENVPLASVRRLRDAGHDVRAVAEDLPGAADRDVLSVAAAEDRMLLTLDRDYGHLVFGELAASLSGVVYFRCGPTPPEDPAEPADRVLELLAAGRPSLSGQFTVVERGRVRQRPLPLPGPPVRPGSPWED